MKMTSVSKRLRRSAWAVIAAGVLAGCATPQPPAVKISLARDAVGRALAAQATQFAPLEMKTAQDKLARMDQAIGEMKYVEVDALADQIEADASLAEAKANAVRKQQVLKQAREGIQVLKQECSTPPRLPTEDLAMRALFFIPVLSALSLVFAGCATPPENPQLLQARSLFSSLQEKPESNTLAAVETRIASNALDRANQVSLHDRTDPQIDQLAYLATQKIALAEQTIVGRKTDAQLDNIAVDRTQVQLDVRTAQLKALQAMKAQPTERGQVITFGDVLFDTGKADLKAGSQRDFQGLANFLVQNPERQVRVEGFTDSVGGDAYNQSLSERRAQAVARGLQRLGVGIERIAVIGYGKQFPVADNQSAQSRQLNRRVEVIVSNDASAVSARR
jgi:outer membrane protein OmpA-like peptidoglycan-associated protein